VGKLREKTEDQRKTRLATRLPGQTKKNNEPKTVGNFRLGGPERRGQAAIKKDREEMA